MSGKPDSEIAKADQVLLGKALLKLRKDADMTQEQVGAELGGDATYISRIENGKRGVRWPTVMRFLRVYGRDLHALADAMKEESKDRDVAHRDGA